MDLTDPQQFDRLKGHPDPTRLTALSLAPQSDIQKCRAAELAIRGQDYPRALDLLRGLDTLLARGLRVKTLVCLAYDKRTPPDERERRWGLVRDTTRAIPPILYNETPPNDIEGVIHMHEALGTLRHHYNDMQGALTAYKTAEVWAEALDMQDRLKAIRANMDNALTALGKPAEAPDDLSHDGELGMHQRLTRAENALLMGDTHTALRATRGVPDDAIHRTTQATERLWAGDGPRAAHLLASRAPTKPDWSLFHAAASIETFACFPRTNLLDPLAAIHQMRHAIQEDTNATHALEYAARVWPLGIGIAAAHQSVWGDLLYVARSLPVLRNRKARDGIWVNHNTFVCSVPQAIRDEIFNDYHGFPPRDPSTLSAPRQYRHRYLKSLEAHGVEHRQVITDKAVLSTWAILHERHPDEGFDLAMAALESRLERHE